VFAVRRDRASDGWFKRSSADFFYRLINWLGAEIIPHHANFRLMSERALWRGPCLPAWTGPSSSTDETKYTLAKMVALSVNGITSLSVRPIRLIVLMGIMLFVVFIGISVWVFGKWLAGHAVQGWTSVMLLFLLIASFQTFAIAVIGKYVGKVYFETQSRPRYIVDQEIDPSPRAARRGTVPPPSSFQKGIRVRRYDRLLCR
jgi:hypothetical protein